MFYYQVVPTIKLPYEVLTYKYPEQLKIGQIVIIDIRGKNDFGIILEINSNLQDNIDNIKSIEESKPYIYSPQSLRFLTNMANNTFNNLSVIVDSMVQSLRLINQKNNKNLSESIYKGQKLDDSINSFLSVKKGINKPPSFLLDPNIIVRIIYLIRTSIINALNTAYISNLEIPYEFNVLVIFPEKKDLANFQNIFSSKDILPHLDSKINLNILEFTGARKKSNQDSLIRILHSSPIYDYTNQANLPTFNIITGTKSSIFLPFWNLDEIIFVDEPNPYYIQDQNSLYYDARDAVFILSQAFEASLHFISRLPSIRLNSMYGDKRLQELVGNYTKITRKPPRMQLLENNTKNDQYSLISNQILQILTDDEDFNEIFANPE